MNYALVSTAIAAAPGEISRKKLRDGTRLLAKMAHKYGIPVTWACTTESARFLAKDITAWKTGYGDEPLLMLDIKPFWEANCGTEGSDDFNNRLNTPASTQAIAAHLVETRQKLPKFVNSEWDKLKRVIPNAAPVVAGAAWKHHLLLHALEKTQFKGLWGYGHADTETDTGCPFGCFYPSAEQHNFSAPATAGIVGLPYLSSVSRKNDCLNLRAALLEGMRSYDVYVENRAWNRWLGYVQHINALEVSELGSEMLERLDAYFSHVARGDTTKLLPLSEMVTDYQKNCRQTEPTCVVVNPVAGAKPPQNGTAVSTGKEVTFFYYDATCYLTFTGGTMEPVDMKNYISHPIPDAPAVPQSIEYHLPKPERFSTRRHRSRLHFTFTIQSTKTMPYGVVLWGDYGGLRLAASNAETVTWIGTHLLFVRIALQPGNNDFEIILTI